MMLTLRQEAILNVIITEYVGRAVPVASQSIAKRRELHLSPATIRNEMADLAEAGYIRRPHVSSGGVPSDKAYRHYVTRMPGEPLLEEKEASSIRRRILQATQDVELWANLAADLLSDLVRNMAVVTGPKAARSTVKRLELVLLHETLALLVLVLREAKTKKRILHLANGVTQDYLTTLSNKLSAVYGGATYEGVMALEAGLTPLERQVVNAAKELLIEEESGRLEEPCVTGLRHLLGQPEFTDGSKASVLMDIVEDREFLKQMLPSLLAGEQYRVVIGEEVTPDEMQDCSVVVCRYGAEDKVSGIVAVIGPTRMEYERSIASVRLLSATMTDLVCELA